MDRRTEIERWHGGCEHIDETERLMIGHEMAAAFFAVLAHADRSLLIHADMFGACRHPHRSRLPKRESIDRPSRPRAARSAVTVTHNVGRSGDFKFNGTAKAFAGMRCHGRYLRCCCEGYGRRGAISSMRA